MKELTGTTIGRYRLRHRIAEGGMADVYLAQDRKRGQEAAIKLVQANDDYRARFRREVKAMSALRHEHILPILDHGEYKSWLYLVTPYIAQGTLDERLAAGPLSPNDANEILQQLADALQFAHEHGITHRDIKPSNVLLAEGMHVYLADFGLAKSGKEQQNLTQSGLLIGTPAYMAPEMMDGSATPASDIYALGVLLYRMVTGQTPFQADTPVALVWKHVHEEPVPPSTLNPALPPVLNGVILRALEKEPEKRFGTPRELAVAYQNALYGLVGASDPDAITEAFTINKIPAVATATTIATMQKKKKMALLAGLGAGLCAAALLLSMFVYGLQHQPSYNSSVSDRLIATATPSHQPGPPSAHMHGKQAQRGATFSQGKTQPPQKGPMTASAAKPAPAPAKPTPPPAKPTPPTPAPKK
jgi:serine/threonine protein kinase